MKIFNLYNRMTDYLGEKLSDGLSTMELFYIVTFCVVFPLIYQRPDNLIQWIQYLSTAVLQAVALPLLGYVSKKSGEKIEKLTQETHDTVMLELSYMKDQQQYDMQERAKMQQIIAEIHEHMATK